MPENMLGGGGGVLTITDIYSVDLSTSLLWENSSLF